MKSVGEQQTMFAWAEDRALLRSTPSADPGAKTGARAEHTSALRLSPIAARQLRDWHQCDKPPPHDAATSRPRCRSPFNYANRTKFHFTVNQDKTFTRQPPLQDTVFQAHGAERLMSRSLQDVEVSWQRDLDCARE